MVGITEAENAQSQSDVFLNFNKVIEKKSLIKAFTSNSCVTFSNDDSTATMNSCTYNLDSNSLLYILAQNCPNSSATTQTVNGSLTITGTESSMTINGNLSFSGAYENSSCDINMVANNDVMTSGGSICGITFEDMESIDENDPNALTSLCSHIN